MTSSSGGSITDSFSLQRFAMAAGREFVVEVTAERLDAALPMMIAASFRLERQRRPVLYWPIVISCSVVLFPLMIWFAFDERERQIFVPVAIGGVLFLIGFFYLIRNWMLNMRNPVVERMVPWTARMTVRRMQRLCPYTVRYRFSDDAYQATIDKFALVRERRAADISLVCRSSRVFAFFPRTIIARAFMVFVDDAEQHAQVARFIEANGISHFDFDEPTAAS